MLAARRTYFPGLWRSVDFMKFWTAETVSLMGSQVSQLALPIVAATLLEATAGQMGVLNASMFIPFLVITLFAGVLVDRVRKKFMMVGANLGRTLLLLMIPLLFMMNALRMEHLYIIGLLSGVLTVLFDLSYQSYLPTLVGRERLVEGNSKLQASAAMAEVGGPGLAGLLIARIGAPFAVMVNSVTFFFSALVMLFIRTKEPEPTKESTKRNILKEIGSGLRVVVGNPYIRAMAGEGAVFNFSNQIIWAVLILFATRELNLGSQTIGLIMAISNIGAILGSMLAGFLGRRIGVGATMLGGMALVCSAPMLLVFAGGPQTFTIGIMVLSFFLQGLGLVITNVHVVSLRQAITPPSMLGRMNASYRFIVTGCAPIGALVGGLLGNAIGLRPTLLVGAIGTILALLPIIFSPVPRLKTVPQSE